MGQTKSSMLIVPSPNPDGDRALLQEILAFELQQATQDDDEEPIFLLWQEECLVLVPSTVASTAAWVLASTTAWEQVRKACLRFVPTRTTVLTAATAGLQFILPSGTILLVTTTETVASERHRLALAKYCLLPSSSTTASSSLSTMPIPQNNDDNNKTNELLVAKKQLRTMDSTSSLSEISGDGSRAKPAVPPQNRIEAPPLDTLSVKILQDQETWDTNFALNTREPYAFETELFQGQILMLVRPLSLEDDPYWSDRIFRKKKRRVIFNIQGKFKRPLRGPLFVGGEITSSMNLSLFTRGILGMLIKLLENGFADLRYSFGDEKKKLCPRIAVPAFSGMERLVVTPQDQTPPPITGDPFDESKEDRAKRIKTKDWEWNTTDTYSFSFFSMYLSLTEWKLVNLPVSPDINLRRLWNDGDFRLVMYEKTGKGKEHPASSISYALNINFRYLGDQRLSKEKEDDEISNGPEDFEDIALDSDRSHRYNILNDETESAYNSLHRSESNIFPAIMECDSSDEEAFYDAESEVLEHSSLHDIPLNPSESAKLLVSIDKLVPAWIHVADSKGQYVRVFAMNVGQTTLLLSAQECEACLYDHGNSQSIREQVNDHFSPRLSEHERSRRCLGLFVKEEGREAIDILRQKATPFHEYFLHKKFKNIENMTVDAIVRGFAARAVSDRHWEEERVVLSEDGVLSCYHPEKRRIRLRVQASSILKVSALPANLMPSMRGYGFVCIETLGRCIYFMFESLEVRDHWLKAFWDLQTSLAQDERSVDSELSRRILNIDQPSEEFLHKSSIWNYKHRRILNCGQYNLKSIGTVENPLDLVREALQLSIQANRDESGERRHLFFKSTGALKRASVQTLSENGRLAFFLNLYHCMVMHAFLVIGPPGSGLKWISFFNNLAYEVGDDLFSISELEHCIIRSKMAHPSQFVSRFVIPRSHYRMSLEKADFRINFALNPGSTSNPTTVLVYSPERIDEQLDFASTMYLQQANVARKSSGSISVTLPRICQWFQDDFGSQEEMLEKIAPYLKKEDYLALQQAKESGTNMNLRFSEFSFKCKPFVLG